MSGQGSSWFRHLEDPKQHSLKFVYVKASVGGEEFSFPVWLRRKKGGPQRTTVGPAPSLGPLIGPPLVRGLMETATTFQRSAVFPEIRPPSERRRYDEDGIFCEKEEAECHSI
ncbi:unnamed protein product [Cyprideis torosa]|uniref:Uncharacterized protein n=1 Tax=Cyprideis torosa TaxID=163714 RepID=A0A7R8ZNQ5_9CRUS|nr:unnamed protein product [Cyprideis torosa]CAG0892151.1 unnamed protein product [Cyprideis torosa]